MKDILTFLQQNPAAVKMLLFTCATFLLFLLVIILVAFRQGREISLWPPKIGPKPQPPMRKEERSLETATNIIASVAVPAAGIDHGTILTTASGSKVKIDSGFYSGATATLYQATMSDGKPVIVKVFWLGAAAIHSWRKEAFGRELRASELLSHPNIAKTIDRGLQGAFPFTVMEHLAGGTLRDFLESRHRIPGTDVFSICSQVAQAIDYAHTQGVLHMDIKPGNIMFESDHKGRVVLGDFGIAQFFSQVMNDITAPEIHGTPGYIAPEVIKMESFSRASDIYSFGVVLYEMIAGRLPFDIRTNLYSLLWEKATEEAPDIRSFRQVQPILAERIFKTLSRDPGERPCSAVAVLSGIENEVRTL